MDDYTAFMHDLDQAKYHINKAISYMLIAYGNAQTREEEEIVFNTEQDLKDSRYAIEKLTEQIEKLFEEG